MTNGVLCHWVADRLVEVYGENPEAQHIKRLRRLGDFLSLLRSVYQDIEEDAQRDEQDGDI